MTDSRSTWDPHVIVCGWRVRFIWGITFKPKRLRVARFYGHRLVAVRLWGDPYSPRCARLLGVQWRRAGGGTDG
jgi:hypothetical protein